MNSGVLHTAAIAGASGVALGAFGAHGLEQQFPGADTQVWDTAVLYHLVHALALLALGTTAARGLRVTAWAFALGILLFSGSLYALALGAPGWLGPVTPLGGLAFVAGWLALLFPRS